MSEWKTSNWGLNRIRTEIFLRSAGCRTGNGTLRQGPINSSEWGRRSERHNRCNGANVHNARRIDCRARTEKHQAELQKHQTEKHELAVRLEEFERNATAAMQNAKQHERLTTEKELRLQLVALPHPVNGLIPSG